MRKVFLGLALLLPVSASAQVPVNYEQCLDHYGMCYSAYVDLQSQYDAGVVLYNNLYVENEYWKGYSNGCENRKQLLLKEVASLKKQLRAAKAKARR